MIQYAVVLIEPRYSMVGDWADPGCYILGVRDDIVEAEQYRDFIIREDNLEPNNVAVIQYQG